MPAPAGDPRSHPVTAGAAPKPTNTTTTHTTQASASVLAPTNDAWVEPDAGVDGVYGLVMVLVVGILFVIALLGFQRKYPKESMIMKRFIFTSHENLSQPASIAHLVSIVSGVFGVQGGARGAGSQPFRDVAGKMVYHLEHSSTWLLIVHGDYTFELVRTEPHGIEGLEELSTWLLFLLKGHISSAGAG